MASAGRCAEQAECAAAQCCAGIPWFGGTCRAMSAEGKNDFTAIFSKVDAWQTLTMK